MASSLALSRLPAAERRARAPHATLVLSAVLVSTAACTGTIDGGDGASSVGPDDELHIPEERIPIPPGPAEMNLRALSPSQVRGALGVLLELTDSELNTIGTLSPQLGASEFSAVNAYRVLLAGAEIDRSSDLAFDAVDASFADAARATRVLGCSPAGADGACVDAFLARFGRLAWRRPWSEEERALYRTLYDSLKATGSAGEALPLLAAAILQSPHFLYVEENGEPAELGSGFLRFTPYEIASRLSLGLWDLPPDAELLDAAERGDLSNDAGLRNQVRRMLTDPRSERGVARALDEYFQVAHIAALEKNSATYPAAKSSLLLAMRDEVSHLLRSFSAPGAAFMDIFSTKAAFANAELGAIYGEQLAGSAATAIELSDPNRTGIMTRGAMLSLLADTDHPSATLRGFFVFEKLLCGEIGMPPAGVTQQLAEFRSGEEAAQLTEREIREKHMGDAACAGCHKLFDPIGFALGGFDGIGAVIAEDQGAPVDVRGSFPVVEGTAATSFIDVSGPAELGQLLASRPESATCVSRHVFRGIVGHEETPWELGEVLPATWQSFLESGDIRGLIEEFLVSDAFLVGQRAEEK